MAAVWAAALLQSWPPSDAQLQHCTLDLARPAPPLLHRRSSVAALEGELGNVDLSASGSTKVRRLVARVAVTDRAWQRWQRC